MELGRRKMRLGDVLVNEGAITIEQLQQGLALQKEQKKRLGLILVDAGFTTEAAISRALSHQMGYDMIELRDVVIEKEILNLISDYELVEKDGMVLIESLKEDEFHEEYEHLQFEKDRVYGISRITWYRGK